MDKIYIGIDPGKSGAIAFINHDGQLIYAEPFNFFGKMMDIRKTAKIIQKLCKNKNPIAVFEKVGSMPRQGIASAFSFGMFTGFQKAILIMLKIPFKEVTPNEWKKHVLKGMPWKVTIGRFKAPKDKSKEEIEELKKKHKREKSKAKRDAKKISIQFVQQTFPNNNYLIQKKTPHDGIADAVCMAYYSYLFDRGKTID